MPGSIVSASPCRNAAAVVQDLTPGATRTRLGMQQAGRRKVGRWRRKRSLFEGEGQEGDEAQEEGASHLRNGCPGNSAAIRHVCASISPISSSLEQHTHQERTHQHAPPTPAWYGGCSRGTCKRGIVGKCSQVVTCGDGWAVASGENSRCGVSRCYAEEAGRGCGGAGRKAGRGG